MSSSHQPDPFDLQRFVEAQEGVFEQAVVEIRQGAKRGHWMWYVFPQLIGLGSSPTARRYAIRSLEEAKGFLAHPLLGDRYAETVEALEGVKGHDAVTVFGQVDALKLRSSLTLFAMAGGGTPVVAALKRWFGDPDPATLALLKVIQTR